MDSYRAVDGVWDGEVGEGDDLVQSCNYRLCVTTNTSNQLPFNAPDDYDASLYVLYQRFYQRERRHRRLVAVQRQRAAAREAGLEQRWRSQHRLLPLRLVEEVSPRRHRHARRLPRPLPQLDAGPALLPRPPTCRCRPGSRASMQRFGYCADEFVDNGGFPWQLYVREGRRMLGLRVITQHDVDQDGPAVLDGVALGSYKMDTHNGQRVAVYEAEERRWVTKNEGDVQVAPAKGPWPVSYGGLVPGKGGVGNLLVPVCLSASHMGFASARMEPVYMMLGHAAGLAAVQVVGSGNTVQDVDVKALQGAAVGRRGHP